MADMYSNSKNPTLSSQAEIPPTGYPQAAQALLKALFGDEFGGYIEFRFLSRQGDPPSNAFILLYPGSTGRRSKDITTNGMTPTLGFASGRPKAGLRRRLQPCLHCVEERP
jgi:hypothetical protein